MSNRNSRWIAAVVMAGLSLPLFAENNSNTTSQSYTRTWVFPAVSFAPTESVSVTVMNIAVAGPNGTKASCTGSVSFNDGTGKAIVVPASKGYAGTPTAFTNLGTGQTAVGSLQNAPSNPSPRTVIEGQVQLTLSPSSAPCSMLLTLEVYDTTSGVSHSAVTTAVEQAPIGFPVAGGRN